MNRRLASHLTVSVIAGLMAWFSLFSWQGLVVKPDRFISPALLGMILVAAVGAVGRWKLRRWYLVLPIQFLVLVVWLQHRLSEQTGWSAWVPTPRGLRQAADAVADGASAVNTYSSPVGLEHADAAAYLLVVSLLVILAVDLLGCGLRRAPWAGLPVVVALTVPISVLEGGLSWIIFAATALMYILLLATEEVERVRAWAQVPARDHGKPVEAEEGATSVRSAAARIGMVTAAGALVLPLLVPVADGFLGSGSGPGDGSGRNDPVRLDNPMVDLRRDLVRRDHLPLVLATTEDTDRGYLRLTVLDRFDGRRWLPSTRDLPDENRANGRLPIAPGLARTATGSSADWDLALLPGFETSWLPAPYPVTSLRAEAGDWRYDGRTMDFANVDENTPTGVHYRLTAFHPDVDPSALDSAPAAPPAVRAQMTDLPDDLPAIIADTAVRVTAAGSTKYQKAVLLQDWFRRTGGFAYSLDPDSGSGTEALIQFITSEKVGYCEQFAAAMTIMARSLGIPARVAVGFLAPEDQGGIDYMYTSDDLHAWPEIYFAGSGWVRFEPTPSTRTGGAPAWTRPTASATPSSVATPSAPATRQLPPLQQTPQATEETTQTGGDASTRAAWSVALVVLVLIGLLPALIRRRQRHSRMHPDEGSTVDQLALGLWTEILATADDLRIVLPEGRSVRQTAHALAVRVGAPADAIANLDRLIAFIERARYGRSFQADEELQTAMAAVVREWTDLLAGAVGRGRRWLALATPRSIVVRRQPMLVDSEVSVPQPVGAAGEIR